MSEPTHRSRETPEGPAIVALGGGHGLFATLQAVRRLTFDVTAVVTVADDGGSSGRLRAELGVIPPGDLRMALAALASDEPEIVDWTRTIQHRFGGVGALAGHSVGNLILAGLTEVLGDPVVALDEMARLLRIRGRVLPMSPIALEIEADVQGLEEDPRVSRCIRGQVAVATTPGKVRRVRLLPSNPPACPDAVTAIDRADLVVLGPGSWFSSVIPHVLVPETRRITVVDERSKGAGAQSCTRAGGDRRILRRASPARTLPTRARFPGRLRGGRLGVGTGRA